MTHLVAHSLGPHGAANDDVIVAAHSEHTRFVVPIKVHPSCEIDTLTILQVDTEVFPIP